MTLIAFACYPDRIEAIADTASYTANASELGQCSKQVTIAHLDALVMTQGDSAFGVRAKVACLEASDQVPTFDQLAAAAPAFLADLWQDRPNPRPSDEGAVFLMGYSHTHDAFTAWLYDAEDDFAGHRLTEPFVMPSPFTQRPSALELDRARRHLDPAQQRALDNWQAMPAPRAPQGVSEWVQLAGDVREQRALQHFLRVIVAGRVFQTTLRRGEVTTRQIHAFADHGEEFLRLIAWTQHPQAQVMECHCGSGARFVDCHLAPHLDEACGCGSGEPLRRCCAIPDLSSRTEALARLGLS